MLAEDISMNVLGGNTALICNQMSQSRRIKLCAGSDDLALRDSGLLHEHIGQDIDRVGNDDVLRIWAYRSNLTRDVTHDADIRLCKIQSGHSRLSSHARRDDDDVGSLRICVVTRSDADRITECGGLHDIKCLAVCLFLVDVDQKDFCRERLK